MLNDGKTFGVSKGLNVGVRSVVQGVNQLKTGAKIVPITTAQAAENEAKAKQALKDGKMPGEN